MKSFRPAVRRTDTDPGGRLDDVGDKPGPAARRGEAGDELIGAFRSSSNRVTYLETAVRGVVIPTPEDTARAEALWEAIKADALPLEMSKELIKRTAEERYGRPNNPVA